MRKATVVFLLVWVASVLLFNVSPVFCASDVERIDQLIKTKGKKELITTICKKNQNNITVLNGGQMQQLRTTDDRYVTAKTILNDLKRMRVSVSEFEKMMGQGAPNSEQKKDPYTEAVSLYLDLKDAEALEAAKGALAQAEKDFGETSIQLSKSLSLLAEIQKSRKQYQEASQYLERLLSIQESKLDSNHRDVADTLSKLIEMYEKQGNAEKVNTLNMLAASRWGGSGKNSRASVGRTDHSNDNDYSGILVVKDKDGAYGAAGVVFVYNSESCYQSCLQEIMQTGTRGTVCNDLSISVPAGTKVSVKAQSGRFMYVIIKTGQNKGKSGYVGASCYMEKTESS